MKWIQRHGRYIWSALLLLFSIVLYHAWLSGSIFTYGDHWYQTAGVLKEYLFPSIWQGNIDVGTVNITLWRFPFDLANGLFGLLSLDATVAHKITTLWPIIFSNGIGAYLLARYITRSAPAGFVAGLVFAFSSYFLAGNTQGHLLITLSANIGVLAFYVFVKGTTERRLPLLVWSGLLLALTAAVDFRFGYLTALLFVVYGVAYAVTIPRTGWAARLRLMCRVAGIPMALFALFNLAWILPTIMAHSLGSNAALGRGLFGNGYWNLLSSLALHHPFWNGDSTVWFTPVSPPAYFWTLPVLAFAGLLLQCRRRQYLFWGLIALVGIFLSKQVDQPFGDVYSWLFAHFPGFNAFREASKFFFYSSLAYSMLIAGLVAYLLKIKQINQPKFWAGLAVMGAVVAVTAINVGSQVIGPAQAIYKPRVMPSDYRIINEYLAKKPGYFRTVWLPSYSRWTDYSTEHPKISAVSIMASNWKSFVDIDGHDSDWPVQERMAELISGNYSQQLFSKAAVKYVIIPPRDTENDNDFYVYYGNNRSYFISVLDKVSWLKRVDIGTRELAIYENTNVRPHITASSNLVSLDDINNLEQDNALLNKTGLAQFDFVERGSGTGGLAAVDYLFSAAKLSADRQSIVDTIESQNAAGATLYKNTSALELSYVADKKKIDILVAPPADPQLNGQTIKTASAKSRPIVSVPLSGQNKYLLLDESIIPIKPSTKQHLGSVSEFTTAGIYSEGNNAISNGSFESGLWQSKVSDCNNHDSNAQIAMSKSSVAAVGKAALQLEATRHIACTNKQFGVQAGKRNLFSLDFQSPNAKQAGYHLQFNDPSNTVINDKMPVTGSGWQSISRSVVVPNGATSVTIYLYAYESDGTTANIVRYDNIAFYQLNLVKNIALPKLADNFIGAAIKLRAGTNNLTMNADGYDTRNLIANPSFESGAWNNAVGDCNRYDNKGAISQKIVKDKPKDGKQSLQLDATRHNACTGTSFNLVGAGNYLMSIDYQGVNTKQGGYYLKFNDNAATTYSERLETKRPGEWQTFVKQIAVPADATSATLTLYAYESDGSKKNSVRYDGLDFSHVPTLDKTYFAVSPAAKKLVMPKKIDFKETSSTRYEVGVAGSEASFLLNFAEAFHTGWTAYLQPVEKTSNLPLMPYTGKHLKINGYANGWIMDSGYIQSHYSYQYWRESASGGIEYKLTISFQPQNWFYIGLGLSATTLLGSIGYLAFCYWRARRRSGSGTVISKW